jgi:predicted ATPase
LLCNNCEHMLDAAAHIAVDLLTAGPHVRVLATSREPLRLPEEQVAFRCQVAPCSNQAWLWLAG